MLAGPGSNDKGWDEVGASQRRREDASKWARMHDQLPAPPFR